MEGATVSIEDFQCICRCCPGDCRNAASFPVPDTLILDNSDRDVFTIGVFGQVSKALVIFKLLALTTTVKGPLILDTEKWDDFVCWVRSM